MVEAARLSVEREDWAYEKDLITGKLYEATQITPHYPHWPHYPHYPHTPGCAPTYINYAQLSFGRCGLHQSLSESSRVGLSVPAIRR